MRQRCSAKQKPECSDSFSLLNKDLHTLSCLQNTFHFSMLSYSFACHISKYQAFQFCIHSTFLCFILKQKNLEHKCRFCIKAAEYIVCSLYKQAGVGKVSGRVEGASKRETICSIVILPTHRLSLSLCRLIFAESSLQLVCSLTSRWRRTCASLSGLVPIRSTSAVVTHKLISHMYH